MILFNIIERYGMESNICTLIECKSIAMQTFLNRYQSEIQQIECKDIKIEYKVKLIKNKKISVEILIRPGYINGLFYGKRFITPLLRVNKISNKKFKIIKIYKKDSIFYCFIKKITKGNDIVKTCRENTSNFFLRFIFAYRYGGEEPATYRGKNLQYLYIIILVLIAVIFAYLIARDHGNSYYWSISFRQSHGLDCAPPAALCMSEACRRKRKKLCSQSA